MKIVVEKNKRKKWFWKIVTDNGKILAHSEDYSSKTKCKKTAVSILSAADAFFEIKE